MYQQSRLEHLSDILVALNEAGPLQPRNRRADLGVGVALLQRDVCLHVIIAQDFARGDDDFPLLAARRRLAQAPQDLRNVTPT